MQVLNIPLDSQFWNEHQLAKNVTGQLVKGSDGRGRTKCLKDLESLDTAEHVLDALFEYHADSVRDGRLRGVWQVSRPR